VPLRLAKKVIRFKPMLEEFNNKYIDKTIDELREYALFIAEKESVKRIHLN
jgi:hypothetical protein